MTYPKGFEKDEDTTDDEVSIIKKYYAIEKSKNQAYDEAKRKKKGPKPYMSPEQLRMFVGILTTITIMFCVYVTIRVMKLELMWLWLLVPLVMILTSKGGREYYWVGNYEYYQRYERSFEG